MKEEEEIQEAAYTEAHALRTARKAEHELDEVREEIRGRGLQAIFPVYYILMSAIPLLNYLFQTEEYL